MQCLLFTITALICWLVVSSSFAMAFLPIEAMQVTNTLPAGTIRALDAPDLVNFFFVLPTYLPVKSSAVAQLIW